MFPQGIQNINYSLKFLVGKKNKQTYYFEINDNWDPKPIRRDIEFKLGDLQPTTTYYRFTKQQSRESPDAQNKNKNDQPNKT